MIEIGDTTGIELHKCVEQVWHLHVYIRTISICEYRKRVVTDEYCFPKTTFSVCETNDNRDAEYYFVWGVLLGSRAGISESCRDQDLYVFGEIPRGLAKSG